MADEGVGSAFSDRFLGQRAVGLEYQRNRLFEVLSGFVKRRGLSVRAGQLLDECNVPSGTF
jgi:hypothetical protein